MRSVSTSTSAHVFAVSVRPTSTATLFAPTLAAVLLVAGCAASADPPEPAFLGADDSERLALPCSEAVRVGEPLFLSGQVGNVLGSKRLVSRGIVEQTHQTLRNMATMLDRHGSSLERVVKCTVFLADIDETSRATLWPAAPSGPTAWPSVRASRSTASRCWVTAQEAAHPPNDEDDLRWLR